jgi:hypothetical protein
VSDEFWEAGERLSSMGDKVAGFAISSSLILTFACLNKDIAKFVTESPGEFAIGTLAAGLIYVGSVVWLYREERNVRALSTLSSGGPLAVVHRLLMLARCLGIAVFTAIGIA